MRDNRPQIFCKYQGVILRASAQYYATTCRHPFQEDSDKHHIFEYEIARIKEGEPRLHRRIKYIAPHEVCLREVKTLSEEDIVLAFSDLLMRATEYCSPYVKYAEATARDPFCEGTSKAWKYARMLRMKFNDLGIIEDDYGPIRGLLEAHMG